MALAYQEPVEGHIHPTEAKEEKRSRKRKYFDGVSESTRYRRVKNIVQQLDENPVVEGALLKTLIRRDSEKLMWATNPN